MVEPAEEIITYTGPRPSPARRWVPWLVVVIVVNALASVSLLVTHLIERHLLQRFKAGHSISSALIDDLDSFNNVMSRIGTATTIAFLVLLLVWTYNRRSDRRLKAEGESAVEPPILSVSSRLYIAFWVFVGLTIVTTRIAASSHHARMSIGDFITYRTYLAGADLFRVGVWISFLILVLVATKQQDEREAATDTAE